jgi:hypothetical protein
MQSFKNNEFKFVKIRSSLLILIFLFGFETFLYAVPVIPNESVISGTVLEYCLTSSSLLNIKPDQVIYRLVISIEEVKEAKGYPNFLADKQGQSISFHSKEKLSPELIQQKVKALVEYTGDERGGLYWIKNIETIR